MSDTPNDSGSKLSPPRPANIPYTALKRDSSPRSSGRLSRPSSSMAAVFDAFGPDSAPRADDVSVDFDSGYESVDDLLRATKSCGDALGTSDSRKPAHLAMPSNRQALELLSDSETPAPVSLLPEDLVDVKLPLPNPKRLRPPPAPKLSSIKLPPPVFSKASDTGKSLSYDADNEVWSPASVALRASRQSVNAPDAVLPLSPALGPAAGLSGVSCPSELGHDTASDEASRDSSLANDPRSADSSVVSNASHASSVLSGAVLVAATRESRGPLSNALTKEKRTSRWRIVGVAAGVLLAVAAFVWLAPSSWKPWMKRSDDASLLAQTHAGADDPAVDEQGQHTIVAHFATGRRLNEDTEEPGDPGDPDDPGDPGDPEDPVEPDDPDQPDPPDDPDSPDMPDLPDDPNGPEPVNRAASKPLAAHAAMAQRHAGGAVAKVDPSPTPMKPMHQSFSTGASAGTQASPGKVISGEKKASTLAGAPPVQPLPSPGAVGSMPFNRAAAVKSINALKASAAACKSADGPNGNARVLITFAPSGRVTVATVPGPPFAGTSVGGCVAATMRRATVPPFVGGNVTVSTMVPLF